MPYKCIEERRRKQREFYEKNKEKLLARKREYYEKNKEKILAQRQREYRQSNPKKHRIITWKKLGIIGNYDEIYERYLATNECEDCGIEMCFGLSGDARTCYHNHDTGEVRGIVCRRCNFKRK